MTNLAAVAVTAAPLPSLVDELASLQAQIAVLEAREGEIKKSLIETGLHEVCGSVSRAVITVVPATQVTDYTAAAKKLLTAEQLAVFTKPRAGSTRVTLYSYN